MFCQKCGQEIPDQAVICVHCQTPATPVNAVQPPPPTYLAQSIIVTVLCCWIFGIPAIVYAAQVNSKYASGDYEGAKKASQNARMWGWISFGIGILVIGGYVLLVGLGAAARMSH